MPHTTDIQEFARQFAQYTNRNVFLTGKAGTGKTTFLRQLHQITGKQIAVVAPTGVAAINAGGTTIHSFFQLPLTPFMPTEAGKKDLIGKLKMQANRRNVIRELELLVIDEISMVRADVMDAIDTVLRHIRYRHNEPFGGVQVIFIGDLYQLSPVAKQDEWQLLSPYYSGIYFFHSQVITQNPPVYIEFEKIFRQQDMGFIRLLNEVRNNCLSEQSFAMLQSRHNALFVPPKNDTYIILTTHNYKADQINSQELAELKGKPRTFKAKIQGDFPEKSFPMEENLELKKGAKVMFVKNDTETPRRFFNGKIGEVVDFDDDVVLVKCPEYKEEIEVKPMIWHNIRYKTNEISLKVEEDILGTFTQFPLRLAWAITIHKSQGLTFDKAVIDAGAAFAAGQVYVALSRCRSLEGIVLQSQINKYSLENDDKIVQFSSQTHSPEELRQQLNTSKQSFYNALLFSIFDFKTMENTAKRWQKDVKEVETSFDDETPDFIQNVLEQISEIQHIGLKFQHQLQDLSTDKERLNERLQAASTYFSEKLENLIETLCQTPAVTDSRENSKIYDGGLDDLYTLAQQKKHLVQGVSGGFNVDDYFTLKNNFALPFFNKSSYSRNSADKQKLTSKHPQLMQRLFNLRNAICDETRLPIYVVANGKTIEQMSNYLPQNEKDMLRIHGFGSVKFEKYGARFLQCIADYCAEHNLTSAMGELFDEKPPRERKPKPPKGESGRITLQSYLDGMSIAEIAKERGLTEGTIIGHLAKMVEAGTLEISRFVTEEELHTAQKILDNLNPEKTVYEQLSAVFAPQKTSFITAWIRGGKKSTL